MTQRLLESGLQTALVELVRTERIRHLKRARAMLEERQQNRVHRTARERSDQRFDDRVAFELVVRAPVLPPCRSSEGRKTFRDFDPYARHALARIRVRLRDA